MQTIPLYLEDSYQKTCQSQVLESSPTRIVLDRTVFYPEGGGQPSDQGIIKSTTGTFKVTQVNLKGDTIEHIGKLSGEILPNQEVESEIDWDRRYHNMQVHSAGHLLHEAVKSLIPNIEPIDGQHGKKAYIKYQGLINTVTNEEIKNKCNEIIKRNLAINTEFVTLEQLQARASWLPAHLPKNKPLRIMWIGNFEPIPDGGTQVLNTSEIPSIANIEIQYDGNSSLVVYKLNIEKHTNNVSYKPQTEQNHVSKEQLMNIKNEAIARVIQAQNPQELEELRIQYLGKKGALAQIASKFSQLSPEQRSEVGQLFNDIKNSIQTSFDAKISTHKESIIPEVDPTLPGIVPTIGHLHPITKAITEISDIFSKIGFIRVRYPEVEWDWFAFTALNFPEDHPARDDWETFFLDNPNDPKMGKMLLTPHTSSGQIREMLNRQPPIRMINIAKCYRRQSDVSHTVMFHQFEGLVVDENITIANLRGTIEYFTKAFFGPNRTSRLRPYHFQFTEPSFEVDISCDICDGRGCRLCKEGWLELGGAGMVHPNVLQACNIDSQKYTGFAFGWGVERTYMMKSGTKIDDIRLLYDNDIRFLNQF